MVMIAAALGGAALGCSPKSEAQTQSGGKAMDDETAVALLKAAEESGKLPEGMEIEHYVGGGLPPPHLRSDQLRLMVREGHLVFRFVTPDFKAEVKQNESYPRKVYERAATPDEVRKIARLVRESGAFGNPPPASGPPVRDRLRTELVILRGGQEAKRVYPGAEPPELTKLRAEIGPLVADLKAHGKHWVER
jgi:hypothetical protein